ncbi:hypothetical protein HY025_03910 [Candidatus Daviesbacteria bacterium]|nr:hypothetical protein [Candidatus Daviesbacteria bacterium]
MSLEQDQFRSHEEWFMNFLWNTDQKQVQIRTIMDFLGSGGFPDLRNRLVDPNYSLGFLFVGGGTGKSELGIANWLLQIRRLVENSQGADVYKDNIDITYEDPSIQMHERFRDEYRAMDLAHLIKERSAERFEDPHFTPPDVDIALGLQMWSYIEGWQGSEFELNPLTKFARTATQKKGFGVLSIQSRGGDLHATRGEHFPELHGHEDIVAEDIEEELKRLQIDFQSVTKSAFTSVGSCFRDGVFNPNSTGKGILSFMFRKDWDSLDPSMQQAVAQKTERLVRLNRRHSLARKPTLIFRDTFIFIPGNQEILGANSV